MKGLTTGNLPGILHAARVEENSTHLPMLAELEGKEPIGEVTHSDVLPNAEEKYRHEFVSDFRIGVQAELYARPVPAAQPVNARLLSAARAVVARWETPLWKDAPATAGFIYELRDAIAAAESAPKAVRLTARECAMATSKSAHVRSDDMLEIARAIETAALRKNGIEVAE